LHRLDFQGFGTYCRLAKPQPFTTGYGLNLLRLCLGQMGATPVDSAKIALPEEEDEEDPADKYF
jgi:hypothetical protein